MCAWRPGPGPTCSSLIGPDTISSSGDSQVNTHPSRGTMAIAFARCMLVAALASGAAGSSGAGGAAAEIHRGAVGGAARATPEASASGGGIDRVHVVWMNHLDVGFTNNIASVLNIYFHEYFTKAIATAAVVNKPGQPPIFRYTSHAWLLDIFLNCPRHLGLQCPASAAAGELGASPDYDPGCVVCPNATLVAAVEQGIRDDIITWHAFPFNAEPELADAGLLLGGIDSVHALDLRFRKKNKTVISQRDVPGVSRAIIPLMRSRGVLAFSEGCNAQIVPPQTPPIFNWTDTASGDSIIMMLHPRGYGVSDTEAGTQRRQAEEAGPDEHGVCPVGLQPKRAILYQFWPIFY